LTFEGQRGSAWPRKGGKTLFGGLKLVGGEHFFFGGKKPVWFWVLRRRNKVYQKNIICFFFFGFVGCITKGGGGFFCPKGGYKATLRVSLKSFNTYSGFVFKEALEKKEKKVLAKGGKKIMGVKLWGTPNPQNREKTVNGLCKKSQGGGGCPTPLMMEETRYMAEVWGEGSAIFFGAHVCVSKKQNNVFVGPKGLEKKKKKNRHMGLLPGGGGVCGGVEKPPPPGFGQKRVPQKRPPPGTQKKGFRGKRKKKNIHTKRKTKKKLPGRNWGRKELFGGKKVQPPTKKFGGESVGGKKQMKKNQAPLTHIDGKQWE